MRLLKHPWLVFKRWKWFLSWPGFTLEKRPLRLLSRLTLMFASTESQWKVSVLENTQADRFAGTDWLSCVFAWYSLQPQRVSCLQDYSNAQPRWRIPWQSKVILSTEANNHIFHSLHWKDENYIFLVFRTQVSLGSGLWVSVSVPSSVQELWLKLCWCDSGWWWYRLNTNWWCQ